MDGYSIAKYVSPSRTVLLFEVQGNYFGASDGWNVSNEANDTSGSGGYSPAGFGVSGGGNANVVAGAGAFTSPVHLVMATGYLRNVTSTDYSRFASATGRHTDGSNFLMADNHAKWFRPNAVSAGSSNGTETDCGGGLTAAGTGCGDGTIAASFSL